LGTGFLDWGKVPLSQLNIRNHGSNYQSVLSQSGSAGRIRSAVDEKVIDGKRLEK